MSSNYKNTNNYSALINEIKSTTLNDKMKGRNHKMYLKRNQSLGGDKSMEIFHQKTVMDPINTVNNEINKKYASIDLRSMDKKKILTGINPIISEYNTKHTDPLKRRNQSISGLSNPNATNVGNKIDIKISVNYNKPNITNPVNHPHANSNTSSGLSSSKSFYQTPINNTQNINSINAINHINSINAMNSFTQTQPNNHNHSSCFTHNNDLELIKRKINSTKPKQNNFNTSCSISDDKFKEKLIEHQSHFGKNNLATSAYGLNHLRNRSQNLLDQNGLDISLMGYENKNLKNYLINQSHMNMNMSINNINNFNNTSNIHNNNNSLHGNNNNNSKLVFSHYKYPSVDKSSNQPSAMNNKLFNYINNNPVVEKKNGGENNNSNNSNNNIKFNNNNTNNHNVTTDDVNHNVISSHMNMKDFSLNKNNEDLIEIVDVVDTQQDMENDNIDNKFLVLETNLDDQLSNIDCDKDSKECVEQDKATSSFQLNTIYPILNKKFHIYKKTSEEYIKLIQSDNNNRNLIEKLFRGYNELVNDLIKNHSEKMAEHQNITTNYKIVSRKYSDLYKAYKEKSDELKLLKSKIAQASSSSKKKIEKEKEKIKTTNSIIDMSLNISNPNIKNTEVSKNQTSNKNDQNNILNTTTTNFEMFTGTGNETQGDLNRSRMIKMMNKNVLDDLDAIYFFDKINMRANSASHKKIPKLDFNFLDKEKEKENYQNLQIQKKIKEEILEKKKEHNFHLNNQMDKMKHNKKTSLLKLEDLIVLPDKEKLMASNTVMNGSKQLGYSLNNQKVSTKYSNYNPSNLLKSNGLHTKKLSSQDLRISSTQMSGSFK